LSNNPRLADLELEKEIERLKAEAGRRAAEMSFGR
jgi:uncharacterized small protein (DUF1192 family)